MAEDESGRAFNEDRARAEQVITRIRERLARLAEERPFRFVATRREDAEDHLRRLTEFAGLDDDEMAAVRHSMGPFPAVYDEFLRQLGRERGALFEGSDVEPRHLFRHRGAADEIMRRCGVESFLEADSVVFMTHQGYSFCYFDAGDGTDFDAPVFQYVECEAAPGEVSPGFAEMLDAEVGLMEENNRLSIDAGGYFITVAGGFERRLYPAMEEGRRPLDAEDELL